MRTTPREFAVSTSPPQAERSTLPAAPAEALRRNPATWLAWLAQCFERDDTYGHHLRGVWHRIVSAGGPGVAHLSTPRRNVLEIAALLHDIGRAVDPDDSEPHAFVGARYLDRLGLHDVATLVAHHSGAKLEALDRHMTHLDVWPEVDRELLTYLDYADRTVSAAGERVTLTERRADIVARRGEDSQNVSRFDTMLPALERAKHTFDAIADRQT